MKKFWLAASAMLLTACSTTPDTTSSTPAALADEDCCSGDSACLEQPTAVVEGFEVEADAVQFGPIPSHPGPAIRGWFGSFLDSPETAYFEWLEPERGYFGTAEAVRTGDGVKFAWLLETTVTEQGDDGEEVRTFHCWMRGDEVVAVFDPARLDPKIGISASLDRE